MATVKKKAQEGETLGWKKVKEKTRPSGIIKKKYKSDDGNYTIKTKGYASDYPTMDEILQGREFTGKKYKTSRTLKGLLGGAKRAGKMKMKSGGKVKKSIKKK